ncbi:MAG: CheR family methyltransferase, partial [Planctomycetaceae bacterium]
MPSAGIKMVAVVLSSGTKAASIISLFESIPTDLGTAWILKIDRWPSLGEPFPTYLSRRSQNPVCVWKQPQELCANTITIIPPEYNLVISQGSLVEAADMMNSSAEDMLLSSAAHEFGDRSVAVVLAGARTAFPGLRCVRNAGGLVLAEPVEAVNASIPLESISEHIDFWIPVQYIPATLMKTNRRSQDMPDPEDHGPWDQAERELVPVFRRLLKLTGIDFSSYKLPTILRRTLRRMELKNFAAISDYARLIEADEQEAKALAKDFLIQVTQFFRDPEAFLHLQEKILPNVLLQTEEVKGIRIWVPACGTGQEVYSLAIIVEELRRSLPVKPPIRIFATDVDDQAIAAARSGIYAPHELTDLSADRIDEFFEKLPNGFSVSASIRDMVTFLPHNLLRDAPFVSLDLVCCRNFLIYLRPDVQRRVLSAFQMGLNLNGILVLGASEHLGDEQTGFEVLSAKWKIFRKVQNAVRFLQLPFNLEHRHPSAAPLEEPIIMRETQQLFAINKAYDDLLSFVGSTGFLFRRNGGLIHIFGEGHKYIQTHPGRWDENLLKLVHPELSLAISNALLTLKDRDNDGDLRISGVPVQFPAPDSTVSITLRKLKADPFEPVYAILLQPDSPAAAERSRTDIDFEHKDQAMKRISQLEFELEQVQSHLRSTIEQLEVSNEELVSTNEEMQGTNEELQASIEELRVANHEHKTTLHRITELHNDLQNLVRRSDVGQIFLARDHTIRLCTP